MSVAAKGPEIAAPHSPNLVPETTLTETAGLGHKLTRDTMLSSRFQEDSLVPPQVDGICLLSISLGSKLFGNIHFHTDTKDGQSTGGAR